MIWIKYSVCFYRVEVQTTVDRFWDIVPKQLGLVSASEFDEFFSRYESEPGMFTLTV